MTNGTASKNCSEEQLCFALEILQVHLVVQAQATFDFFQGAWLGGKRIVDVVAGLHVIGIVSEFAATEILHLADGCTFRFHFFRDDAYEFFHAAIRSLGIENNDSFIFPAHVTD